MSLAELGKFYYGECTATNAVAAVVNDPNVTLDSNIILTLKTANGANAGQAFVFAKVAGTSFSINNTGADTSVYKYVIHNRV